MTKLSVFIHFPVMLLCICLFLMKTGPRALRQTLETGVTQKISTDDIVTIDGVTLKNCFNKIRQQVLCIFKNDCGNKFLFTHATIIL